MEPKDQRHYAVPDPNDSTVMTYWCIGSSRPVRYARSAEFRPWPPQAHYGPRINFREEDAPEDRAERKSWIDSICEPPRLYRQAVEAAIAADPVAAGRRFAKFAIRCCICGRTLTDDLSKCYGIGPDCRRGLSSEFLAQYFTPEVGRAHAASGTAASAGEQSSAAAGGEG